MTTLRAVLAVAAKDFRIARSYRLGFALTIFGFFWSLVSFRFLSKLVNVGQFAGDPTSYFRFVVVGVVLTSVLHAAASSAANAARSDQVQGTLEYLATQPVSRLALGLGWAAYSVLESLIAAVVILFASFPLGFRVADPNIPVAIAALALSSMVFCAIGIIGASVVVAFQQGQSLAGTAASLAGLISGTMFPVTVLPAWVRPFSDASPLTHALAALRYFHSPRTAAHVPGRRPLVPGGVLCGAARSVRARLGAGLSMRPTPRGSQHLLIPNQSAPTGAK